MNCRSTLYTILGTVCSFSFVSCDKTRDFYETAKDKIKEIKNGSLKEGEAGGGLVKEAVSVNETDGKAIIKSERRLVIVEFYSDT